MFAGEHGEPARRGISDLPLRGPHMKHGKTRLFALAAAHGASLLAVPPVLQAAETGQLEEIVVTARQREERIEDVPVSITAFTASEIRSAGIERPLDFIALTTGVSQVQTAEAGDLQVNIRGINTGRDCRNQLRARHRWRAADQSAGAEPGAFGHHADRSPEGPARRALRPQRAGRCADPDDAQARRRVGRGSHGRFRQRQQLQGQLLHGWPDRPTA